MQDKFIIRRWIVPRSRLICMYNFRPLLDWRVRVFYTQRHIMSSENIITPSVYLLRARCCQIPFSSHLRPNKQRSSLPHTQRKMAIHNIKLTGDACRRKLRRKITAQTHTNISVVFILLNYIYVTVFSLYRLL